MFTFCRPPVLHFLFLLLVLLCGPAKHAACADQPFSQWLDQYGAHDVLERELADQTSTPEVTLTRARLLLRLNAPQQSLELLDSQAPFPSPSLEAERLWIRGQSLRMDGQAIQALLAYTAAASLMERPSRQKMFEQEPQLDRFFKDVWLHWFWSGFTGSSVQADEGQKVMMLKSARLAAGMWPEDRFWKRVLELDPFADPPGDRVTVPLDMDVLPVLQSDREAIARSLGACAVTDWPRARTLVSGLSGLELRSFWQLFITALEQGSSALPSRSAFLPCPNSAAFWDLYGLDFALKDQGRWVVSGPEADFWQDFLHNLASLPPAQALTRINAELESTLLAPEITSALGQLFMAYSLLDSRFESALQQSASPAPDSLPLSLRLARLVLEPSPPAPTELLNPSGRDLGPVLWKLAQAAGRSEPSPLASPFWLRLPDTALLTDAHQAWPLDRSLAYAVHADQWRQSRDTHSARRMSFLYPQTLPGQQAHLLLAKEYQEEGRKDLAWQLLDSIPFDRLDSTVRDDFLEARAGLAMEMGREKLALSSYEELLRQDPGRMSADRKLKLALLAQNRGRFDLAEEILTGLRQSPGLEPALQAEVLFWIAEGRQQQGDLEQALDHYLELAWKYPGQNIWAITALYRAGLIYQQRGMHAPARELFTAVLEQADRESQKEAAKDRIEALEATPGSREEDSKTPWIYPF